MNFLRPNHNVWRIERAASMRGFHRLRVLHEVEG